MYSLNPFLSESDREVRRKDHQAIYEKLERKYIEEFRSKILENWKGKFAVVSLQKDGKIELFLLENEKDFSKIPNFSINYKTIVGFEDQYKAERLKKSRKKAKGLIIDTQEFIHQYQINMIYEFLDGSQFPGVKNFDSGENEISILETEPSIQPLALYPNSRGNDSVCVSTVHIPCIENGQVVQRPIIGNIDAELDPDWTSFGNVIARHLDIFMAPRRQELYYSFNQMTPVQATQVQFLVNAATLPDEELRVCGELPCLGKWFPGDVVQLNFMGNNTWIGLIWLPKHLRFEWKLIKFNTHGNQIVWEGAGPADNRIGYVDTGTSFNVNWLG